MYGGPLWDLFECQADFGNILHRSKMQRCNFLLCRRKKMQTKVKTFITKREDIVCLPRAKKRKK